MNGSLRCLVAAGFAIGIAVGSAGLAKAEPIWDTDQFDQCMQAVDGVTPVMEPAVLIYRDECCQDSGGVKTYPNGGDKDVVCVAPPAESESSSQSPIINRPIPGGVLTRVPSAPLPPQQLPGGQLPEQVDG